MKIFSADQIRKADFFTLENEPITSLNLMERAATECVKILSRLFKKNENFCLFCGTGNNGGDGFAVARMLYLKGYEVTVFSDLESLVFSADAKTNLWHLQQIAGITLLDFDEFENFTFRENSVIVDAIFGTGINREPDKKISGLIKALNAQQFPKIAIDIPSGLWADKLPDKNAVIFKADETLSFQFWKKTFLHPESGIFCGNITIVDIGLDRRFIDQEPSQNHVIDDTVIRKIYRPREKFSHKGSFGKTMLLAGSFGKMGAAVLATKAAVKSGSGLTFVVAPQCGCEILQVSCPEAIYLYAGENHVKFIEADADAAAGIGPGLGTDPETEAALLTFLKNYRKPLILDADALNCLAKNVESLKLIPEKSIITPHPKEFERLFGKSENSFKRLLLAKEKANELGIYIVLKDQHTQIITPENNVFYNITGNPGMAKGGSGDALTGILSSLLAQNYSPEDAAVFGVWLHGKAGDFAAEKKSEEAMTASDLIDEISTVFQFLNGKV